jgi:hypothetical protein
MGFQKPLQTVLKKSAKKLNPGGFRKPVHAVSSSLSKPFFTAPAAFCQIGSNVRVSTEACKKFLCKHFSEHGNETPL